jgi:hypothetical protein
MLAQAVSSDRKREPGASWAGTLTTTAPVLLVIPPNLLLDGGRMSLIASSILVAVAWFAVTTFLIRKGRIVVTANGRSKWRRNDSPHS